MKFYELEDRLHKATSGKRQTVDLADLRAYILHRANAENLAANKDEVSEDGYGYRFGRNFSAGVERNFLSGYNRAIEDVIHILGAYHGFQSRDWDAFCSCEKWYQVVKRLQEIDSAAGTRHYWKLLDRLDRKSHYADGERKYFYGGNADIDGADFRVTSAERKRAERIAAHYARVLQV